jgi:NDP-sugar pyrophosphorylase family protein
MKLALEEASEAEVIVLNGDTYTDVDLLDLMREFDSAGVDLAVAVTYEYHCPIRRNRHRREK